MKKSLWLFFVILLTVSLITTFSLAGCKVEADDGETEEVETTDTGEDDAIAETDIETTEALEGTVEFGSWRTEDIALWDSMLANFTEKYPDVTVNFQPTKNTEYDAQLTSALETGVGPDIMFLRSFDDGEAIYDAGYLVELGDEVSALSDFPDAAINAWATDDGVIYGVPMAGVTHGIFYNTAIFDKYGLTEPATWAEFLDVCQTLKDNGETVIAQGTNDRWDLYEVMYSGLGANFYGGEESRQALVAGEMKMTDQPFVDAFAAMDQLQPYFPDGYESIDYVGMQQLFGTGQAAMYVGGSWEIATFEGLGLTDIGWFPPPVENEGDTLQYCFHVDYGIGVNKDSENLDAALALANWLATPEFAAIMMEETPGFFSYVPGDYTISNELASEMIAAASDADVTIRTTWEKLMSGVPSGYDLMLEAMAGILIDEYTPEEAAAHVQDGLEQWYEPMQ